MEPELGPRKQAVLRAVVEEFVRSGEPVGSERVAELSGLGVSSATIRNELAALEELGFLTHAHTSSGRLPTDLGYRRYVDALRGGTKLREAQRRAIAGFFADTMLDLDFVLKGTTQLLSRLTQYAGLAVPPSDAEESLLRVEVLDMASTLMLLIVGQHGSVDKAILDRPQGLDAASLASLDRRLAGAFRGLSRSDAQALASKMAAEAQGAERDVLLVIADRLADLALAPRVPQVLVGGVANLADDAAHWRRDTLRHLFEAIERENEMLRLLRDVTADDVTVTIGAEHPRTGEWDAAIVSAPFRAGSTSLGTIGVVGPTAMDYGTVVASVREVARRLSELATALGAR